MTQEEHLSERRQALNTAINKRDLDAMISFLDPAFVGKRPDGSCIDYQSMVQQCAALMGKLPKDFVSQVVVENCDVSGDSAKLMVRRIEGRRLDPAKTYWAGLGAGIAIGVTGWNAAIAAVKLATHRIELLDAAGFIVTFLAMIGLFYYLRPKPFQKEVKAQETWRRVDGRWLLAEEQEF